MRNSVLEFFCDVCVATRYWYTANSLLVSNTLLTNFEEEIILAIAGSPDSQVL